MCEKCGSALSDDNAAHCYSAEPKRPCVETQANDTASTQCNGISSSTSDAVISTSALSSTSDNSVRPQALYVNVNNQAFPVLGVAATTSASATSSAPVQGSTRANSSVSNAVSTTVFSTSLSAVPPVRTLPSAQISLPSRPTNVGSVTVTQITLPTYNLQPPYVSNVARLPVATPVHTSVQSAATVAPVPSSSYVFQVTAVQIRLGARKFKPLTAVTFKDDGVLFTLTGMLAN